MTAAPARRAELAAHLGAVRERIELACSAAGRRPEAVRLIVVTKFFPASDLAALADLGVRDVGESRDQEAAAKLADLPGRDRLTVHFIGQLQSNKAGHVARYADVVHSLDRAKAVRALDRGAAAAGRQIAGLVQVSLDGVPGRAGVPPEAARGLADLIADSEHLTLRGVMAVAPLQADPDRAFDRLHAVADEIRQDHPGADWISAGMSADLESAVAHGATHLRVGSAILGSRLSHR